MKERTVREERRRRERTFVIRSTSGWSGAVGGFVSSPETAAEEGCMEEWSHKRRVLP
jgi:hypothetical protein|uniref:Uncharacterized protein n=1 Tax=Arabidopsis thaliana TaxID=3702 RepID=Q56X45_ARATH|nr:hypothetical protein [Arabidopsis thaliana]